MKFKEDLRLPGVYFLTPQPPAAPFLPPLDVPAFVGFAERGPLHLPVAIEDPGAFAAVFGGDLPLAVERHTRPDSPASPPDLNTAGLSAALHSGSTVYANLPRCVSAFFANGGRRCYVVRVAGRQAQSAHFGLPGMVALRSSTTPARLASAAASSPGAWANRMRLSTRLQVTPLSAPAFTWVDTPAGPALTTRAERLARAGQPLLQPGDVLRLGLDDGSTWLGSVSAVTTSLPPGAPSTDDRAVQLAQIYRLWHDLSGANVLAAARLTFDAPQALLSTGALTFLDGQAALTLHPDDLAVLRAGDQLFLNLADGRTLIMPLDSLEARSAPASPPLSPPVLAFQAAGSGLLQIAPPAAPAASLTLISLEALRFDLLPRLGDQSLPPLPGLSFNNGGRRFWGEVILLETAARRAPPSHASRSTTGSRQPANPAYAAAEWFRRATGDSFGIAPPDFLPLSLDLLEELPADPLAALSGILAPLGSDSTLPYDVRTADPRAAYPSLAEQSALTYLPLGMAVFFQEGDTRAFSGPQEGCLGDDDLSFFDPLAFVDPRLASGPGGLGETYQTLLATAVDLHEIQGRRLYGLHSLLFIDEVALLSAPDAVQAPWETVEALPAPPPPRPQRQPPPLDCPPDPTFIACDRPPRVFDVEPYFGPLRQQTPVVILGEGFEDSLETTVLFGRRPASLVVVVSSQEIHCLAPAGLQEGEVTVQVVNANGAGELVSAFIYQPSTADFNLSPLPVIDLDAPEVEAAEEGFLAVHHAMLNFCQARADCLAILSLPRRYDLPRCLQWQDSLRARLGLPALGLAGSSALYSDELADIADLSFAAVYHPWLLVSSTTANQGRPSLPQAAPPDGAICGLIAARERQRGVWVAPANLLLRDVVGLNPALSDDDWAILFARRFNLARRESDGYRPMSAHTLADRADLLQISVRRLMILLRKMALRLGMDFVFESNHERFREGARVVIEDMLRDLYQRGAFAGASREQSFRVLTDQTVNPPASVDAGRFVIVIQVAPSQPMEFITVQLTRTGEGELLTLES